MKLVSIGYDLSTQYRYSLKYLLYVLEIDLTKLLLNIFHKLLRIKKFLLPNTPQLFCPKSAGDSTIWTICCWAYVSIMDGFSLPSFSQNYF